MNPASIGNFDETHMCFNGPEEPDGTLVDIEQLARDIQELKEDVKNHGYLITDLYSKKNKLEFRLDKLEETTSNEKEEEWPKVGDSYWMIDLFSGNDMFESRWCDAPVDKDRLASGNCFRTKEEAELAIEKLKAWKRLKDAGFKFTSWEAVDEDEKGVVWSIEAVSGLSLPKKEELNLLFSEEVK